MSISAINPVMPKLSGKGIIKNNNFSKTNDVQTDTVFFRGKHDAVFSKIDEYLITCAEYKNLNKEKMKIPKSLEDKVEEIYSEFLASTDIRKALIKRTMQQNNDAKYHYILARYSAVINQNIYNKEQCNMNDIVDIEFFTNYILGSERSFK